MKFKTRFGNQAKDFINRLTINVEDVRHYGRGYQSLGEDTDRNTFNESHIEESFILSKDDE